MSAKPIKKLYYSISEVSELTGLKPYVLRYWETEFVELRPAKNRAGNRIYKDKDIDLIKKIKDLLYTKKYTIEGARNYMRTESGNGKEEELVSAGNENEQLILKIKTELESALDLLNGN